MNMSIASMLNVVHHAAYLNLVVIFQKKKLCYIFIQAYQN